MSDTKGPMVDQATRQPDDTATHVERINPGDNPAAVPWAAGAYPAPQLPPDRGPLLPFVALGKGTVGSRLLRGGETVMLYADEAGSNFRPMVAPPPDMDAVRSMAMAGGDQRHGLTIEDRRRLQWLRSQDELGELESAEEAGLARRESYPRPKPPLMPLTDAEWDYLAWLRTPDRPLTADEEAELQNMNQRAAISPPRSAKGTVPADPDLQPPPAA